MAFGTKLELWLPDHESLWGRRLKWFLDPIRDITIRVPQGFSFAALDGRSNLPGPLLRIRNAAGRSRLARLLINTFSLC
jgi:hypothetical protein